MSRKLGELGVEVDSAEVIARSNGAVGRVHMAQELVQLGVCGDTQEAFDRFIGFGRPGYVPKKNLLPAEGVRVIAAAGGCAVFAHPGVTEASEEILRQLARDGLVGVEAHYPMHSPEQERDYMELARELDLVVTGGSDFHGAPKPGTRMGMEAVSGVELDALGARRPESARR